MTNRPAVLGMIASLFLASCTAESPQVIVETPPASSASSTDPDRSGSNAPFNRGAAAKALGEVSAQSCKQTEAMTGHVTVTFDLDGTVSKAVMDDGIPPDSPEATCLLARYRAISVPPFSGSPVRVGKAISLK